MLQIENLSVSYDGKNLAVDHVSLDVKRGEIVTLVGESGSGKSTLLHTILGLMPQNGSVLTGKIQLFGEDILQTGAQRLQKMRGDQISMIFQDAGRYMNPTSRIGKQYRTFLKSHNRYSDKECDETAIDMLQRLQLQDPERVLKAYPFELSGGMCQRVAIAMAMTLRPKLLLADEPTSALDVTMQAQVIQQMLELKKQFGTTIVMVTHNMGVAAYISDYIGVMQNGRLIERNAAKELIRHPAHAYTVSLLDSVIELEDERFAG